MIDPLARLRQFADRLFQREEMDGDGRCPTYLVRWTLLKLWGGRGFYLHHFVGNDWSVDLHDHPKRFVSIGLKGAYREIVPASFGQLTFRIYRAPWIRTFRATHIHRIELLGGRPCWTLVYVMKNQRPWGFWHQHQWIPWRTYVDSETATRMKSCP